MGSDMYLNEMKKIDMNTVKTNKSKWSWYDIDFVEAKKKVLKLQERITLAYEEKDLNRVKQLQENLVNSWSGLYTAVQTVCSKKGRNTPGVDGEVWTTRDEKEKAVRLLKKLVRNPNIYKASPTRRVEIPKANGKPRALGIPTMIDRAYQTLWNMALIPIAECDADERSYGGRPFRRAQDSMTYLWLILVPRKTITDKNPYTWVLDADIEGYFDNISHEWILGNIPMDCVVLKKWLKAGVEITENKRKKIIETNAGVSQGSPISPTIANMALDGLQKLMIESTHDLIYRVLKKEKRLDGKRKVERKKHVKTYFVRYVDDFLVICNSKKAIEERILPIIKKFLELRGLNLNSQKTKIISTKEGFNYVGFAVRMEKSGGSRHGVFLKIKPAKQNVKEFKAKLKAIVKKVNNNQTRLIQELNPVLRGWANYYKGVHAKRTFSHLDYYLVRLLQKWAIRKYRGQNFKGKPKAYAKVFHKIGGVKWRFVAKTEKGGVEAVLIMMSKIPIERHFIAKDGLNPYKIQDRKVLLRDTIKSARKKEVNRKIRDVAKRTDFLCAVCGEYLDIGNKSESLHVHHIVRRSQQGPDTKTNLLVLHQECHMQVTHTKNATLVAKFAEQGIIADREGKVNRLKLFWKVKQSTKAVRKTKLTKPK